MTVSIASSLRKPTPPATEKKTIRQVRQAAVLSRWESVKNEKEKWLEPFRKLPLERALVYLDDLRKVVESAGYIMNARINDPKLPIKCEFCKKDLSGLTPGGQVKYIGCKYLKNERNPTLGRNAFFCSAACDNDWVRAGSGARGADGK